VKHEKWFIRLATIVVWGYVVVAVVLVFRDHVALGATMFGLGLATAALLLPVGRRLSELDHLEHRLRQDAEVVRLLESIDRRLARLALTLTSQGSAQRTW
jgi:hypothetical protein